MNCRPIIPIIFTQKRHKMHHIYNVLEGFQGILPLRHIYKDFVIENSFVWGVVY